MPYTPREREPEHDGLLLLQGDPRLDPALERPLARERAREFLESYVADGALQAEALARMISFLFAHDDALERTCVPGHFTSSALVIDAERKHGLLTLHKKLGRWLQLGGHCDGDGNFAGSALREAHEESGIQDLAIDPLPIDLDIHGIPAHGTDPEHLHLDVRFLVQAPRGAVIRPSDESHELRWFREDDLEGIETDDSVRRLFRLAHLR